MDHRKIAEAVASRMEATWGNPEAYAACFTVDGDLLNRFGELFLGRPAIQAQMMRFFAGPAGRGKHTMHVMDSRVAAPGVVLMHVQSHLEFPPGGPAPEAHNRQTMVLVEEDGEWKISAFQNTTITTPPRGPQ